ncbi:two-component sensor histidine kinase [Jeotgalibacillus sp. S-D1]|uniref:ATP-binding protein n=1 Tax=Jeotgalibacillus sp. S-D1 TaxID=2552189 RepID=UPI0010596807|nr:ATP-binding protein [Jeotgalibacillus sp. S-D1]TDL34894.1 two-component sensor histidine kinase [Jeotgalibacillus sp. S-D1]
MGFITKDLLINFLFVLLPLFLVQMFYLLKYTQETDKLKNWMLIFFPVMSIILCMAFPANIAEGLIVDFRRIPFVLGVLYGGWPAALLLLSTILGIRFMIGGSGFFIALVMYPLLTVILLLIANKYKELSIFQRIGINVLLLPLSESLLLYIADLYFSLAIPLNVQLTFFVLNVTGMLIVIILWETVSKNFELLERVAKTKKLEVVSHLAASMSHEVRNPLTVTKGFMQLLHAQDLTHDTRKKYLDLGLQELDRAVDIINDYLMFAKPAAEKKDHVNVYEELEQSIKVLEPYCKPLNVHLKLKGEEEPSLTVLGEHSKLEQCFINLIKNGAEAMSDGGIVLVTISYSKDAVLVTIEDNGEGMTTEQISKLGEPYYTTKNKGTGLGMMVSYSIIQNMQGKIKVRSKKGSGTCFIIKLPLSSANI